MDQKVRVRYAPSPTGFLHIGNAQSALFNYLFARHFDGTMVLRIEDTDTKRNVEDGEASQRENLHWLGIDWDEGQISQIQSMPLTVKVNGIKKVFTTNTFKNY